MADVAGGEAAAFWSLDASDVEQHVVHIPGLGREGNHRPAPKSQRPRSADTKPRIPHPAPPAEMDVMPDLPAHANTQVTHHEDGTRSASLKDLCPEDKRRIANLIKELARVSEEKEVTEERLKMEHESFAKKIRHLEEQNSHIATEREALQQQYRECQELLSLYQKYLSEQQEKLNRSLFELGPRSARPQQVPKLQPSLPTASELDGSYLGQPSRNPPRKPESSCSSVDQQPCRNKATSRSSCRCSVDGCPSDRCASAALPALRCTDAPRAHCCVSDRPMSHCCMHSAAHGIPGAYPPEPSTLRPPEHCKCSTAPSLSNGAPGRDSPCRKDLSEQRKHELLLQKMELEIERERLQQLLDQQEVKLLEKQRQLQQTRLECQRRSPATDTPARDPPINAANASSPDAAFLTNGAVNRSPVRKLSAGFSTPPSSSPARISSAARGASQSRVCADSKKDAATSPSITSPRMKERGAPPGHQADVCRYETSLIDMLEALSPKPSQRRQPKYREPYDFSMISPPSRGYPRPSHQPVPPTKRPVPTIDPEESRILEDIFFIC